MKLRIIGLLLIMALPAIGREITYQGIIYEVINETEKTVKTGRQLSWMLEKIEIPSFIKDKSTEKIFFVKEIGSYMFLSHGYRSAPNLKYITLPKTIEKIDDHAFWGCEKLESINLPNNLQHLGDEAFGQCSSLKSIKLPEGLTSISRGAFDMCSNLESVEFSSTIKTIGEDAFLGCKLKSIEIPDNVIEIGRAAFSHCDSLEYVKLPCNITTISEYTFSWCKKLKHLDIPESVKDIQSSAFACTSLNVDIIPEWMTDIPDGLLRGCHMDTIRIPDWVKTIGWTSFSGCGASEVLLTPNIRSIDEMAFASNKLEKIVFPPGIKEIGESVVCENKNLKTIVIPSSLEKIAANAFGPTHAYGDDYYHSVPLDIEEVFCAATTPPTIIATKYVKERIIFNKPLPGATIYLPEQSMEIYRQEWPAVFEDIRGQLTKFEHTVPLVMAEAVVLDCDRIEEPKEGDVYELKASVLPEDALQYVFFKSTDTRMATVTQDGVVTIKDPTVNPGDSGIGYCEILVYSVYSEEPMAVCRIGDSSGVEQTVIGGEAPAAAEIDYSLPLEVYNLSGARVASSTVGLQPGVYIIRQGAATAKIAVK